MSVPEAEPGAEGWKTTDIVHVPPAARVAGDIGQVFVWLKFALAEIELIETAAFRAFLSVIALGALLNPKGTVPREREVSERETGMTPVPLRATGSETGEPESPMVRVPDAAPVAAGANVTEIVQLLPAASEDPQVELLTAKGLPTPTAIPVIETAAVD